MFGNTLPVLWHGIQYRVSTYCSAFGELPEESKVWAFVGLGLFGVTALFGGAILQASFMAALFCIGAWTCLLERAPWAEKICKGGVVADILVTFGALFVTGGTMGVMWAVIMFGVYFTCARRILTPVIHLFRESWDRRQEEKKLAKAEEEESEATGPEPDSCPLIPEGAWCHV